MDSGYFFLTIAMDLVQSHKANRSRFRIHCWEMFISKLALSTILFQPPDSLRLN